MPRKNDFPDYFVWRDGHPRWNPGRGVRALGFKGVDLKDEKGRWLSKGAAIDKAEALNAAVAAQRHAIKTGEAFAPLPAAQGPRTLAALCDDFQKRSKFTGGETDRPGKRVLARKTVLTYARHCRILCAWAGDVAATALTPEMVEDFYNVLARERGSAEANAIMRSLRAVMIYGRDVKKWPIDNPVKGLEMDKVEGRLVVWTAAEISAFVRCADWLGLPSLGDAVILGVMTGQRAGDVLTMREGQLADGFYQIEQSKTGKRVKVRAVLKLLARIHEARARKASRWGNVAHMTEIVREQTGGAYDAEGSVFRDYFYRARLVAAGVAFSIENAMRVLMGQPPLIRNLPFDPLPSLVDKHFQDLRDTAVTWLFRAGCSQAEIATITGHSLKTVNEILDKHYFVRDDALAVSAGAKYEAFLATEKLEW